MTGSPREIVLLVRAGARLCGVPVSAVGETMRPLPVSPVAGAPSWVTGVAVLRGEPTPVVDLAALLGDPAEAAPGRFVSVRAGGRPAALAVGAVIGVAALDPAAGRKLPLVGDACAGGALESLRVLDGDLLAVLGAARLVPEAAVAAVAGPPRVTEEPRGRVPRKRERT